MDSLASQLTALVLRSVGPLLDVGEARAGQPRAAGAWSPKEILGHLVDSASNHHQRFVRGAREDGLALPGYEQDAWVRVQGYAEAAWSDLVPLWRSLNLHLAHVLARIPAAAWEHRCTIGAGEPVRLDFLAQDYLRHTAHHLAQILEGTAAAAARPGAPR